MDNLSFAENLSNIKEEPQIDHDAGEIKLDISETVMCMDSINVEPYKTKNNNDDLITNIYETTSNRSIKEEEKIIIDDTAVPLENIKYEPMDVQISFEDDMILPTNSQYSYCKKCKRDYEGFCPSCPKLCYILHNISKISHENLRNTVPIGILEVRDTASGVGIFALKNIPKGVIFGPSKDFLSVQSTNGMWWKIENRKLISTQNKNWMQCVNSAQNILYKNLEIFQYRNCLYFRSIREINEDEQLLYLNEEYGDNSMGVEATYYCPRVEEKLENVFACTFCCLGFKLKTYLEEHKTQCSRSAKKVIDEEIIQCPFCNIFLQETEYLQNHWFYCSGRHARKYEGIDQINDTPTTHKELHQDFSNQEDINNDVLHEKYKSAKCTFATSYRSTVKAYNIVDNRFKCDKCYFESNKRTSLKTHQLTHTKPISDEKFKCDKCHFESHYRSRLKTHQLSHPTSYPTSAKKYNCYKCCFETIYKRALRKHQLSHTNRPSIKKYKCHKCDFKTEYKNSIEGHQLTHLDPTSDKKYSCDKCEFQTHRKNSIEGHKFTHADPVAEKKYKCDKCKFQTHYKNYAKTHQLRHADALAEKKYKCDKCNYQTNGKRTLKSHQLTHLDPTSDKKYSCDKCNYQTNYKSSLNVHLFIHADPLAEKKYKCDKCNYQTNGKRNLKSHQLAHSKPTSDKKYKCDNCDYRVNRIDFLNKHLNVCFAHSNKE